MEKHKIARPFEEAIAMTGFGKFNLYVLLATGGCLMCVIIETMCASFIIPAAQCDLNLSLGEKGILYSISFLGVVSTSFLWGFLADMKGRKDVLVNCLFFSAIISFFCSIVPWSWLFILLRYFNGALIGGSSAIIYAFGGEFHDKVYRPKIVSWISTFVAFGNMFLPGLAWLILPLEWSYDIPLINLPFRPWRLLVIIYALPSLIFAFLLYLLPESPKFLLTQGKKDEVLKILTKMYTINTGKSAEEYMVSEVMWDEMEGPHHEKNESFLTSVWEQIAPLFRKTYLLKTTMLCFLHFGTFLASSGVMMWYPDILNYMSHYSIEVSNQDVELCTSIKYFQDIKTSTNVLLESILESNSTSQTILCNDTVNTNVFSVVLTVSGIYAIIYFLIGTFINTLGKKNLLVGLLAVSGICGTCTHFVSGYTFIEILTGIYVMNGAGIGIINALIVDVYPTQIRAMGLAVPLMFGRFGAMAGSNIVGPLFYNFCDYFFFVFGALHLLIIIAIILLPTKSNALPDIK